MKRTETQKTREEILAHYQAFGYAVIPDALSAEELDELNRLVDRELAADPDSWHKPIEGAVGNGSLLLKYPREMDRFVRHRKLFPLIQEVLRGEARFAQFDFRDITVERASGSAMGFHRDISWYGTVGGKIWDPENPYKSTYACVIYYLKDVHDCCPAFCLVPNSHEYGTLDEAKEKLGAAYEEVPIRGKAGTAILYNITTYHTRKGGKPECAHGRRTMHNYHSRESSAPLTNWATVPEELALSADKDTRLFYSQWTPNQIKYARDHYKQPVPSYYPVKSIK
ncbi:Phytanoyl-CoA dioxygenase (PhyH) [Paenibacillus sp. UNC496MF]|uniref:phytanoyl-CoA dioxygenase family protein n=1 Tax=Paenibacillus sp. UNC496MF TaxID=1502753 RepID=UPI0008E6BA71|nr:phytanoyl-CoA dioxygenase family protein [Paenibacillus sp. UNC496MF]SFI38429.1 Phytanoyl-CoA dioxygenase (PhyH) [Paenibacillus sp. UNC496MF]